jgi:hypothetical protein
MELSFVNKKRRTFAPLKKRHSIIVFLIDEKERQKQ